MLKDFRDYIKLVDEPVQKKSILGYEDTGLNLDQVDWVTWPCDQHIRFLRDCIDMRMGGIFKSYDSRDVQEGRKQAFNNHKELLDEFGYNRHWRMQCVEIGPGVFAWYKVGPEHPLWRKKSRKYSRKGK